MPEDRFMRLTGLWLETYEELAKTLRNLPDPITLPPVTSDQEMIRRMTDAAGEASAILFDREETAQNGINQFLANALLFWLAAFDMIGWSEIDPEPAWRAEAVLLVLRQATSQAVVATEWLRNGPPMPPPFSVN